jgi:hypothetical protein
VEYDPDDPTTTCSERCANAIAKPISWRLLILRTRDQPDHEGLIPASNREQARTKNLQSRIANIDESFIEEVGILSVRSTGGRFDTRAYGEVAAIG